MMAQKCCKLFSALNGC